MGGPTHFLRERPWGRGCGASARVKRGRRSPIAKINWKPMKARKFGYDVACACPPVRTHTSCNSMPNVRLCWRESVWPPASCEAETTKESVPFEILLKKKMYIYIYIYIYIFPTVKPALLLLFYNKEENGNFTITEGILAR